MFDKSTIQAIQSEISAALKQIAEKHNLTMDGTRVSYTKPKEVFTKPIWRYILKMDGEYIIELSRFPYTNDSRFVEWIDNPEESGYRVWTFHVHDWKEG